MPRLIQCPNPSCRRASHLGEDPLGRIFRCPRCLTKLPVGHLEAPDSGWMAVLGPLPRKFTSFVPSKGVLESPAKSRLPETVRQPLIHTSVQHALAIVPKSQQPGFESGSFYSQSIDLLADDSWDSITPADAISQASDEVCSASAEHNVLSDESRFSLTLGGQANSRCQLDGTKEKSHLNGSSSQSGTCWRLSRFEILEVLGKGRQAIVYRALDPVLQRHVALKLCRRETAQSCRAGDRFFREARALAQLTHPRIVPVYEAGRDGNCQYIAMALIEGQGLAELIAGRSLSFLRTAEIVAELAEALAHAHGLGIVHRDVKPANIRLDKQGAVYLMDFGIAHCPDSREVAYPPGTILGTPAYLAPEQATGEQPTGSPASDQYSLGAVLYEMLCGQPPFSGPLSTVIFHVLHDAPPSPRSIEHKVPRPLAAICQKAMTRQPQNRYPGCLDLAGDLRRWIRGEVPVVCRRSWLRWNW
jgi:eukaryotic-like serine/threonine-protein kinase